MAVTVTAQWQLETCTSGVSTEKVTLAKNGTKNISYSGTEKCLVLSEAGYYKLEAWGAQGGSVSAEGISVTGGYGGYSVGIIRMEASRILYVVVGGQGAVNTVNDQNLAGGYNGGGSNLKYSWGIAGTGGGATHFSLVNGLLVNLSDYKGYLSTDGSYYISNKILMVAGGGASGGIETSGLNRYYKSANGGGYVGNTKYNVNYSGNPVGGSQTSSKFGGGCSGNSWLGGPGGGWFCDGGGGSGYIGSSNLISGGGITKHMTCYSCSTSTAAATRTYSNTTTPTSTPTADVARIGNGYARITYLGTSI